jgi:hypothetical protein
VGLGPARGNRAVGACATTRPYSRRGNIGELLRNTPLVGFYRAGRVGMSRPLGLGPPGSSWGTGTDKGPRASSLASGGLLQVSADFHPTAVQGGRASERPPRGVARCMRWYSHGEIGTFYPEEPGTPAGQPYLAQRRRVRRHVYQTLSVSTPDDWEGARRRRARLHIGM